MELVYCANVSIVECTELFREGTFQTGIAAAGSDYRASARLGRQRK